MKYCLQQESKGPLSKKDMLTDNGMLKLKDRWYVLCMENLKNLILDKFHKIPYLGHPGYQKMITTMKNIYYWLGMKR